jgi:dTDP-4-dehydrorhamnose 3,5-epimerase
MNLIPTEFEGLAVIQPKVFRDHRGSFVKTYHEKIFAELGFRFRPAEEFFSVSNKNVLRGMHFQVPPAAHAKLVYCLAGHVLDVAVDLRKNSKTFGKAFSRELNETNREMLFMPEGFAHGFHTLSDQATMCYVVSTVHSPEHDKGIAWNSFGFAWPLENPIVAERDAKFPAFRDFPSPF